MNQRAVFGRHGASLAPKGGAPQSAASDGLDRAAAILAVHSSIGCKTPVTDEQAARTLVALA